MVAGLSIALVSSEYPPFRGGGIGTYAAEYSRALAAAGNSVHVFANRWEPGAGDVTEQCAPNLTVHRLDVLNDAYEVSHGFRNTQAGACRLAVSHLVWACAVADELAAVHQDVTFDIAEFPDCFAEGYVSIARRQAGGALAGLPMVVMMHTPIFEHTTSNGQARRGPGFERRVAAENFAMQNADALYSPSQALVDRVEDRLPGLWSERGGAVVPYPFDARRVGAPKPVDLDPNLVFFAGRLELRKGVSDFLDGLLPLLQERPSLRLQIAGKDADAGVAGASMLEFLRSRVPPALADRVDFLGNVEQQQLYALFARAACTVMPQRWDNFPFVCCEAMSCKAALAVSDAGGLPEIVEADRSAIVFESGRPESLRRAVESVLALPDHAASLRESARLRIERLCDPERVLQRRIAGYREVIERFQCRRASCA